MKTKHEIAVEIAEEVIATYFPHGTPVAMKSGLWPSDLHQLVAQYVEARDREVLIVMKNGMPCCAKCGAQDYPLQNHVCSGKPMAGESK
jgi:hypothetical protein